MLVYFVRHGESQGNIAKIHQPPESPLTPVGLKQAAFIAHRFSSIKIDKIISSTYQRAAQTAQIISQKIGKDIELSPLVTEWKMPSEIKGKAFDDQQALEIIKIMRAHDHPNWHYSDEENMYDLQNRADKFLQYLAQHTDEAILITTHSFFLKILIAVMIFGKDKPSQMLRDWSNSLSSNNTGITLCEYDREADSWRLITYNDHSHLG